MAYKFFETTPMVQSSHATPLRVSLCSSLLTNCTASDRDASCLPSPSSSHAQWKQLNNWANNINNTYSKRSQGVIINYSPALQAEWNVMGKIVPWPGIKKCNQIITLSKRQANRRAKNQVGVINCLCFLYLLSEFFSILTN